VFVGSFFLFNIVLAVIMEAFDAADKNEKKEASKKLELYMLLLDHYEIEDDQLTESEKGNYSPP
jgi:hypothetical protein